MPGLELAQVVLELADAPLQTPVVDVGAHLKAEAGAQVLVLLPVQGHLSFVLFGEELGKTALLLLGGLLGAAQLRGQAASVTPHTLLPPLPGPGTGRRDRRGRPASWWPGRPASAAHAGTHAGSAHGCARPLSGRGLRSAGPAPGPEPAGPRWTAGWTAGPSPAPDEFPRRPCPACPGTPP